MKKHFHFLRVPWVYIRYITTSEEKVIRLRRTFSTEWRGYIPENIRKPVAFGYINKLTKKEQ